MTYTQAVDAYFQEHRAKLIDIAAFFDRLDRAPGNKAPRHDDPRVAALRRCIALLNDGQPNRARRVLETLSDPTTAPTDQPGSPATGAYTPPNTPSSNANT